MDRPQFMYVTYIASTPEKVWDALTNGEFTRQYWGGRRIQSDWQVGSPVRHYKDSGELDWQGEVLEVDRPWRLVYTFDPLSDEEMPEYEGEAVDLQKREAPSRVSFDIAEYMGQVRLSLIHDNFEPGSRVYQGISYGWPAILSGLKTWLERGKVLFPDFR